MRCWNCGKRIPDKAKVCGFCEAAVQEEPTQEEQERVSNLLSEMPADVLDELRAAFQHSDTAEEFADSILVGNCPKCGSEETGNCEADPEIGELLVGRCYRCGQLWCTECRRLLEGNSPSCECWDEDEDWLDEDEG